VDLQVQTGTKCTNMCFFLTDLGHHRVILGYPWFAANQPKIDWARGWIDTIQLPLILRDAKAEKPQFNPNMHDLPDPVDLETLYIGRIIVTPQIARQTTSSMLAEEHDRPNLTPIVTGTWDRARLHPVDRGKFWEPALWFVISLPSDVLSLLSDVSVMCP